MYQKVFNKDAWLNLRRILSIRWVEPQPVAMPVCVVNDHNYDFSNVLRSSGYITTASTTTLYTVPAGKEFFLRFATISYTKQTSNDNQTARIEVVTEGATRTVISAVGCLNNATASNPTAGTINIRLNAGDVVQYTLGALTVGTIGTEATIHGYLRDAI